MHRGLSSKECAPRPLEQRAHDALLESAQHALGCAFVPCASLGRVPCFGVRQSDAVHRNIKPQILSAFGDLALAIGDKYEIYLPHVLQMLTSAQVNTFFACGARRGGGLLPLCCIPAHSRACLWLQTAAAAGVHWTARCPAIQSPSCTFFVHPKLV
jgi:hypothetical protein